MTRRILAAVAVALAAAGTAHADDPIDDGGIRLPHSVGYVDGVPVAVGTAPVATVTEPAVRAPEQVVVVTAPTRLPETK